MVCGLKRLVIATEGRELQVVASFARFLGEHGGNASAVTEVSCDMSPAFIKCVREFLPKANVTFDRFHVAKILGDAVERVRRTEWRIDKTVTGGRFALLKNPTNLTDRQREQLKVITSRNAALAEVYRMKETFRDLYRQPDIVAATGFLRGCIATAMDATLKPPVSRQVHQQPGQRHSALVHDAHDQRGAGGTQQTAAGSEAQGQRLPAPPHLHHHGLPHCRETEPAGVVALPLPGGYPLISE